jgi:DNA-binding transcriptional ArsR family regulator
MAKAQKTARDSENGPNEQGLESVKGGAGAAEPLKLERLIHARMRLAIVSALAVNPALSFSELKAMLGATDGNLSVHARKLEDAGYIECTKSFRSSRTPATSSARSPSRTGLRAPSIASATRDDWPWTAISSTWAL